jgi:hypothetical protein
VNREARLAALEKATVVARDLRYAWTDAEGYLHVEQGDQRYRWELGHEDYHGRPTAHLDRLVGDTWAFVGAAYADEPLDTCALANTSLAPGDLIGATVRLEDGTARRVTAEPEGLWLNRYGGGVCPVCVEVGHTPCVERALAFASVRGRTAVWEALQTFTEWDDVWNEPGLDRLVAHVAVALDRAERGR